MPEVTEATVISALRHVEDPELHRDIVSLDMVRNLQIAGDTVSMTLMLTTPACPLTGPFKEAVETALLDIPGVSTANVALDAEVRGHHAPADRKPLDEAFARCAEAALKGNNDIAGMMAILNTLRTTPQNLGPATGYGNTPVMAALPAPTTTADAVNLLFRERAFWTFSRGQRLGDLRRLIRLYGRAADGSDTFPTGPFFKGGTYGADVNFPVTVDEQNNPQWQQCIDRKA